MLNQASLSFVAFVSLVWCVPLSNFSYFPDIQAGQRDAAGDIEYDFSKEKGSVLKLAKNATDDDYALLWKYQEMDHASAVAAIETLWNKKDRKTLQLLYESQIRYAGITAFIVTKNSQANEAVQFCTSLELTTGVWSFAVRGLAYHKKDVVIGYLKQISRSDLAEVRGTCYHVCRKAKWDDLLGQAEEDKDCTLQMLGFGNVIGQTVGSFATAYIAEFRK